MGSVEVRWKKGVFKRKTGEKVKLGGFNKEHKGGEESEKFRYETCLVVRPWS